MWVEFHLCLIMTVDLIWFNFKFRFDQFFNIEYNYKLRTVTIRNSWRNFCVQTAYANKRPVADDSKLHRSQIATLKGVQKMKVGELAIIFLVLSDICMCMMMNK